MKQTVLFDELSLFYPDDFLIMDKDDLMKNFGTTERWAIRQADRHVVISIAKTRSHALFSALLSAKSFSDSIRTGMKKKLRHFRCDQELETRIAGKQAYGYRYQYQVPGSDIPQCGEILIIKQKKYYYLFQYYTRPEWNQQNLPVFQALLDSVVLSEA